MKEDIWNYVANNTVWNYLICGGHLEGTSLRWCSLSRITSGISCLDNGSKHQKSGWSTGGRPLTTVEEMRSSLRNHKLTTPQNRTQTKTTRSSGSRHISGPETAWIRPFGSNSSEETMTKEPQRAEEISFGPSVSTTVATCHSGLGLAAPHCQSCLTKQGWSPTLDALT